MSTTLQRELLLGLRSLARSPGLAALAVLAIGLGTALTTGVFGLTDAILFQRPPYPTLDRLVFIDRMDEHGEMRFQRVTAADFKRWREHGSSLERMFGYYMGTANLAAPGLPPERLNGAFTTPEFLEVLGLEVALGRGFTAADGMPDAPAVVLISDELWRTRFRADNRAIGRTIRVNGEDRAIIGVLPPGVRPPQREHLWLPLSNDGEVGSWHRNTDVSLKVVGLLRPGTTVAQAEQELRAVDPSGAEGPASVQTTLSRMNSFGMVGGKPSRQMLTVIAMVLFVFVISVANAANLQLARYCERAREVAIRAALGATRRQLVRELLLESLLIGVLGGVVGLVLALWFLEVIHMGSLRLEPPYWIRIGLDARAFVFTLVVSLGAGLVSGLLPTWRITALDLNPILKDGGRNLTSLRQGRFSRGLAMLQLGLTATVLILTGLTVRSVSAIDRADLGYNPDQVMTARMALFQNDYPTPAARQEFLASLIGSLEQRPGIRAASATTWLADGQKRASHRVTLPERRAPGTPATAEFVAPGFFRSLGRELVAGRDFTADECHAPGASVLINQILARNLFGTEDPVGRQVQINRGGTDQEPPVLTVVGVAPDVCLAFALHNQEIMPALYFPLGAADLTFATVSLYTQLQPDTALRLLRAEVQKLDADLPMYFTRTVREALTIATWELRLWSATFQLFGVAALLLSGVGLHGLMANAVRQRRQEISVRLALGATRREVVRLVLGRAIWQLTFGLGVGFAVAALLAMQFGGLFGSAQPLDPAVYGGTLAFLVTLALIACAPPLRRALKANPFQSLRWE